MYRYFRATCREDGEADENSIIEVPPPPLAIAFSAGILVGILIAFTAL